MYPKSYHTALNAIIRGSGRSARPLIAKALRELRRTESVYSGREGREITGRQWARNERAHMQYVSGRPWLREG